MSVLTVSYALLFYLATAILVLGVARKIYIYARTPQPLKIPTMPAPTTRLGVVVRMVKEVTVFESLFKSNKWIWLFGWVFHFTLLVVLLRHLRYFTEPVWTMIALIQPFSIAGFGISELRACGRGVSWYVLSTRRITCAGALWRSPAADMTYLAHTTSWRSAFLGLLHFDWRQHPADRCCWCISHWSPLMMVFRCQAARPRRVLQSHLNQVDNPRSAAVMAGGEIDNTRVGTR